MGPALSSLHHLQSLIVKDKETVKNKQKFIRCMRVCTMYLIVPSLHLYIQLSVCHCLLDISYCGSAPGPT